MFDEMERYSYEKNQLLEVICNLRFPTILRIAAEEPAEFQEAVRGEFPKYLVRQDQPGPKISGVGTPNPVLEKVKPVTNYNFISADGIWRLNLTQNFIALTCQKYTDWENFARTLDKPLARFIKAYKPAFFERVGLRYLNAFSRRALGLEGTPWSELIRPSYLGLLAERGVQEEKMTRCTQDAEMQLPGGCRLKAHMGPGMVRKTGLPEDKEIRFILDLDLSMSGNVPVGHAATAMQTLHLNSTSVFRSALTDTLHDAMKPRKL